MQCFGPVAVFDVRGTEVQSVNWSLENHEEAALILILYGALTRTYPQLKDTNRIGIISPYKAQVQSPCIWLCHRHACFSSQASLWRRKTDAMRHNLQTPSEAGRELQIDHFSRRGLCC